ncbi:MAG: methyltransferase domain-containing protein, partial [Thermoplasmata archaeon]|nr:methyltransferase domain-containing protein [Thermoplasmata archaeon]
GIVSGYDVLEIGGGSGSLTMMMASAVMPDGKITSYEREPRSVKVIRKNLEISGLSPYVELREADAQDCEDVNLYDVVTTDMPEPWKIMDIIEKALKPGGHYCAYVPSMNQVEATVKCLRQRNFFDVRAQETLLRNIVVGEKGTRPDYQMLGHTGYLCFARYLGDGQ